jgi:aldose sugar dehydrogenase
MQSVPTPTRLVSSPRQAFQPSTQTMMRLQFLVAAALIAACGGGNSAAPSSSPGTAAPAPTPAPTPSAPPTAVRAQVVSVATGLTDPWGMAFLPDGRMLVTEKAGQLRIVTAAGAVGSPITGVPAVDSAGQGGLLDVVLDPAFASNRRIYLSFSEREGSNNGTAVYRAELDASDTKLNNGSVIYQQLPKVPGTNGHYGSRLVFDKTGHLFVTLGDRQSGSQRGFAQDTTRGNGKVVRITTNGDAAPGNPTVTGASVKGLWSWGHRNPQGAALHPTTGELWTNEHGPQGGDEINRTLAGKNYGWPVISYGQEYGTTTPVGVEAKDGMEQPASYWITRDGSPYSGGAKASMAPSGMAFYTADKFPEWKGNAFVGALAGTAVWRLVLSSDGSSITGRERLAAPTNERIRDVRQGPDGNIYLLGGTNILRIQPQP